MDFSVITKPIVVDNDLMMNILILFHLFSFVFKNVRGKPILLIIRSVYRGRAKLILDLPTGPYAV